MTTKTDTTADESSIDSQVLAGTPVGGPGGSAVCDACNRRLSDGERRADLPDADADTVAVYATQSPETGTWALRWVSCEACGPPDDGELDDPDEATATATLGYSQRIGAFELENVRNVEIGD
jgi:hypothetical protein